jgi:hypothetical protein
LAIFQSWPVLLSFIGALVAAVGVLLSALQQSSYQKALDEKNEKIISLQEAAFGQITGGDSFPYGQLLSDFNMLVLLPNGQYPIYDLSVEWVDASDFQLPNSLQDVLAQRHRMIVGNLYPHLSAAFPFPDNMMPADGAHKRINLFYTARNGYWVQEVLLFAVNSRVLAATRVKKGVVGQVIFEKVDEGFPLEALDDAQWIVSEPKVNAQ